MFHTLDNANRDARVLDAAGAFLAGELERLDQELHMPLFNTTWSRDISVREDVTIGDDSSSFMNATFAAAGGYNPSGKSWAAKNPNAITGIVADLGKTVNPLNTWAMELGYSILELENSLRVARPIDTTKYEGIKIKYNMDVDEQVYVGDAGLGVYGLANSPLVSVTNAPNGVSTSPLWANKTPQEIMNDVNLVLSNAWVASGMTTVPSKLLVPPLKYGYLVQNIVSNAGSTSIMEYLKKNSLASAQNGRDLEIVPVKWLTGRGVSGVDRIVAYTQDKSRVRIPLTPLLNTQVQNIGIKMFTYYYGKIGVVEITQTELMYYLDGV